MRHHKSKGYEVKEDSFGCGGVVLRRNPNKKDFLRQSVKGIFFFKDNTDKMTSKQLVEDLGCKILVETTTSLTVSSSRCRLKDLKDLHLAKEEDISQISSRLKNHFTRILIGGAS